MLQLLGLEQTVLQILDRSVLQLNYIKKQQENTSSRHEGMPTKRCEEREGEKEKQRTCVPEREREIPGPLAPLFICLSPPPGPALCKLDQPGMLFVLPEVLTLVLRPSFILISQAFPFLVFQPTPFQTPVSYSNYQTLFLFLNDILKSHQFLLVNIQLVVQKVYLTNEANF